MKRLFALFIFTFLLIPNFVVNANSIENSYVLVSQTEKYYKSISCNNLYDFRSLDSNNSYTIEISEEEYNNADGNTTLANATIETTYKKLVSSIYQNGTRYRYKAELTWKNMPSTRSYDIIGIGHYASVSLNTGPYFSLYYCKTDGTCNTTNSYYPQTFSTGAGASFKLPTGSLTDLVATFYFDVVKTNNVTVYGQLAAADYSHATRSVTANQAMDYTVGTGGINLGSGISNKYDAVSTANATWEGSW